MDDPTLVVDSLESTSIDHVYEEAQRAKKDTESRGLTF